MDIMGIKDRKELRKVVTTEINRVTGVEVLPIYNKQTAVAHILEAAEKLVQQKVMEAHKIGYYAGVNNFSGYFLDSSLKACRNLIMPDMALKLLKNYRYPTQHFNHNKKGGNNE